MFVVRGDTIAAHTKTQERHQLRKLLSKTRLRFWKKDNRDLASVRFEIRDQHLFVSLPRFFLRRVVQFDSLDVEITKELSHLRYVIQGQNELAPDLLKLTGQLLEISLAQIVAIQFPSKIRRVQIEQRRGAIESVDHFLVRRAFQLDPL